MIEPGDVIIWPAGTRTISNSDNRYVFGHAELGCNMDFAEVEPGLYVKPTHSNQKQWPDLRKKDFWKAGSFWPFGISSATHYPETCEIYRCSDIADGNGGFLVNLALEICGRKIAATNEWRGRNSPVFPNWASLVQSKMYQWLGSTPLPSQTARSTHVVSHAVTTRYWPNFYQFLAECPDPTKGDFSVQALHWTTAHQLYCSQFIVATFQLAAFYAAAYDIKRPDSPWPRDSALLLNDAVNNPFWIHLRPRAAFPEVLRSYLRRAPGWRFVGRPGAGAVADLGDQKAVMQLHQAVTAGLGHYKQNLRSKWRLTSSAEADLAREQLNSFLRAPSGLDKKGHALRACLEDMLPGVQVSAQFAVPRAARENGQVQRRFLPLNARKSRLYECLVLALMGTVPEQFYFSGLALGKMPGFRQVGRPPGGGSPRR